MLNEEFDPKMILPILNEEFDPKNDITDTKRRIHRSTTKNPSVQINKCVIDFLDIENFRYDTILIEISAIFILINIVHARYLYRKISMAISKETNFSIFLSIFISKNIEKLVSSILISKRQYRIE